MNILAEVDQVVILTMETNSETEFFSKTKYSEYLLLQVLPKLRMHDRQEKKKSVTLA